MHVVRLVLLDFRSYAEVDVELGPGPTAFVGRNGQGKTNSTVSTDAMTTKTCYIDLRERNPHGDRALWTSPGPWQDHKPRDRPTRSGRAPEEDS